MKFGQNRMQTSFCGQNLTISKCWYELEMRSGHQNLITSFSLPIMCLCKFGQNPSIGSGDRVQTRSYADTDADRIRTKTICATFVELRAGTTHIFMPPNLLIPKIRLKRPRLKPTHFSKVQLMYRYNC